MNLTALANDKEAKQFARIHAGEYADDIFQDALLAMAELPKHKVEQIEADKATPYYFRQVIYNMSKAMYRANNIADNRIVSLSYLEDTLEADGIDINNIDCEGNDIESQINDEYVNMNIPPNVVTKLNEMRFYDREVFLLYSELGSFRKVEQRTGINYVSIHRTVKKVQDELRPILNGNK